MKKTAIERFFKYVDKANGCWIWHGYSLPNSYGRLKVSGKMVLAHRFSWEIHNGEIPKGLDILHKCDNPKCVNPDHLWLGTHQDNMKDMIEKGRLATGQNHSSKTHPEAIIKGEQRKGAKLTNQKIIKIRELALNGMSHRAIAKVFNVHHKIIGEILRGKLWKHVI